MLIKRPTPEWIEKSLGKYGRNPYGQPLFRIIWSDNRTLWCFGELVAKYPEVHCWVLEKWLPATYYGPQEAWYAVRDWEPGSPNFGAPVLGPYPARGDYESSYLFTELPSSSAVPRVIVELVCRLIEAGKAHTRSTRWAAIKEAREKAERDWKKFFDDYCADKLNAISCRSGLRFGPWSHRGEQRGPDNMKFDRDSRSLPRWMPRNGFTQIPAEMASVKERLLAKS